MDQCTCSINPNDLAGAIADGIREALHAPGQRTLPIVVRPRPVARRLPPEGPAPLSWCVDAPRRE